MSRSDFQIEISLPVVPVDDPGQPRTRASTPKASLEAIQGVFLLSNGKPRAFEILDGVRSILREQNPGLGTKLATKPLASKPFTSDVVDEIVENRYAFVTGLGS